MDDKGPSRRHTMAYSMVDAEEAKKRHGGTVNGLAPTEEMQAVVPSQTATVKSIVSQLIERDVAAWTALPQEVRDMMLFVPGNFTIIPSKLSGGMPHISFNGVELRWNGADCWVLVTIKR